MRIRYPETDQTRAIAAQLGIRLRKKKHILDDLGNGVADIAVGGVAGHGKVTIHDYGRVDITLTSLTPEQATVVLDAVRLIEKLVVPHHQKPVVTAS